MTIRGARCALALAFIALMSSQAVAKDWFGRPDEPCEPKCYWWWWLGRDQAPQNPSVPPTQPAPDAMQAAAPAANRGQPAIWMCRD